MLRTLVAILALAQTAHADTCSGSGSINVSSSCSEYNCFDGADLRMRSDISCTSGVSEADCAELCCSQTNCMGFDYSASDHGWPVTDMRGQCCTSSVSRNEGGFTYDGSTYRNCEKNNVTCPVTTPSVPPPVPHTAESVVECWIDILTESNTGKKCWESCPPLHTKGGSWCKVYEMAEKVCCGDDCCEPNVGAIVGVAISIVVGLTLLIVFSCYQGRCGCFGYRRDQLIAAAIGPF